MEAFAEKISSYNILNFLLPGATFLFVLPVFVRDVSIPEDLFAQLVIAYFCGLIISRVGSIFIENILKLFRILKPGAYPDYVKACRADSKIEVLLETCNMYRTFASGSLVCLGLGIYYGTLPLMSPKFWILFAIVLLLLASFVKQHRYVSKRVSANL